MRRLRRSLKFLHWEQGKGKSKFVQKVISSGIAVDSRLVLLSIALFPPLIKSLFRFLLLVLNKAERAWAYAMQLRDKPDGQGNIRSCHYQFDALMSTSLSMVAVGREVHHLMRRLGKAAKYGEIFEQLSKEKADDRTALEAEVKTLNMICCMCSLLNFFSRMAGICSLPAGQFFTRTGEVGACTG
jgi:hypothetical protein